MPYVHKKDFFYINAKPNNILVFKLTLLHLNTKDFFLHNEGC
jgi:hypothetical protein